jgi:hypothetical protein
MKSLVIVICISTIYLSAYCQNDQKKNLKDQLKQEYKKELFGIDVSADIDAAMDTIINKAQASYDQKPTEDNYSLINKNFLILIDKVKNDKVKSVGSNESYTIDKKRFKKTVKKLCPLYPFC